MARLSKKLSKSTGLYQHPRQNKYRARKTEIDGIKFPSQKEANKYCELKLLKRAGVIKDFELQPEFELQPKFKDAEGHSYQPIKYRADFRVIYPDGREEIIDTKGYRTKEYILKQKMLLFRYPGIRFTEE